MGLIGLHTVRCMTVESFENDELLAGLHSVFQDADRAFTVIPETAVSGIKSAHEIVNLSARMTVRV